MVKKIITEQKLKTEKVPILLIYSKDGELHTQINENDNFDIFRIYGFLDIYLSDLKNKLLNNDLEEES